MDTEQGFVKSRVVVQQQLALMADAVHSDYDQFKIVQHRFREVLASHARRQSLQDGPHLEVIDNIIGGQAGHNGASIGAKHDQPL